MATEELKTKVSVEGTETALGFLKELQKGFGRVEKDIRNVDSALNLYSDTVYKKFRKGTSDSIDSLSEFGDVLRKMGTQMPHDQFGRVSEAIKITKKNIVDLQSKWENLGEGGASDELRVNSEEILAINEQNLKALEYELKEYKQIHNIIGDTDDALNQNLKILENLGRAGVDVNLFAVKRNEILQEEIKLRSGVIQNFEEQKKKEQELKQATLDANKNAQKHLDISEKNVSSYEAIRQKVNAMRRNIQNASTTTNIMGSTYADINKETQEIANQIADMDENTSLEEVQKLANEFEAIATSTERIEKIQENSLRIAHKNYTIEHRTNSLLMERIKKEKNSLQLAFQWVKMGPKRIKDAIGATGEAGAAVAKIMESAVAGIGKAMMAIPGLGAVLGVGAFLAAMLEMDAKVKGQIKGMIALTAASAEWQNVVQGSNIPYAKISDKIGAIVQGNMDIAKTLRVDTDEVLKWQQSIVEAGFKLGNGLGILDDIKNEVRGISAMSTRLGMEINSVAQMYGEVRETLGGTFGEVQESFTQLINYAEDSGMTLSRFYQKVVTASTGLGVWGTKLTDVGQLMGWFTKNLNLPEQEATAFADKMIKGWQDMSVEQKILLAQNSTFEKDFNEALKNGNIERFKTIMGWEGRTNDEVANTIAQMRKIPEGWDRTVRALNVADPKKQIQTQYESFIKALGIDPNGDPKKVANSILKMSDIGLNAIGKQFNLTSQADIQNFRRVIEALGKNGKGVTALGDDWETITKEANDATIKAQDEEIRKQTLPITDLLKNNVAYLLQSIYSWLSGKLYPAFMKLLGYSKMAVGIFGGDEFETSGLLDVLAGDRAAISAKIGDVDTKIAENIENIRGEKDTKKLASLKQEQKQLVGERYALVEKQKTLEAKDIQMRKLIKEKKSPDEVKKEYEGLDKKTLDEMEIIIETMRKRRDDPKNRSGYIETDVEEEGMYGKEVLTKIKTALMAKGPGAKNEPIIELIKDIWVNPVDDTVETKAAMDQLRETNPSAYDAYNATSPVVDIPYVNPLLKTRSRSDTGIGSASSNAVNKILVDPQNVTPPVTPPASSVVPPSALLPPATIGQSSVNSHNNNTTTINVYAVSGEQIEALAIRIKKEVDESFLMDA